METCETHNKCIVVFNGNGCPLCKAEETLKTIWEEIEQSMSILKDLKQTAEQAGLQFK
jgi:hypothetical protein